MKSRKHSAKAGSNKKKVPSDVSVSTSLPPLVEGQLRCFLCVTISRVLWTVHKPPAQTFIRLRWWGESSNGTHFFPKDGSKLSQKTIKTTARFPIRCGPKQFTSYLTDMGSLVLEVLTKPDHLPVARAQVAGISRLSLSQPISGFYTLVSPTSQKLGELQISLNFEPLTEVYDSSSPVPATDVSTDGLHVPSQTVHRHASAGSGKESAGSSGENTPRGKDHLYFQNNKQEKMKNQTTIPDKPHNTETIFNPSAQKSCLGETTDDIISVIIERGNKLRNAMVVSALKCDLDSAPPLRDAPLPLSNDNIQPPARLPSVSGTFLQDILLAESALKHPVDGSLDCEFNGAGDMDKRAVDLLLGSSITSSLPLLDVQGFSPESLSDHSSVGADSEPNDPLYDLSLLENLFYKTPISDARPDDTEEKDGGAMSLTENQLTQSAPKTCEVLNSGHQQSEDGSGSFDPPLSEEQLALLSFTRLARVTVSSLSVATATSPKQTSNRGKPPRPLTSRRCTYFVEYVFPSTTTQHGRHGNKAGDGEVTRAVSSKMTGGAVRFHQLSVFPVHFDRATVTKWWETDLLFKIYVRKSDQKKPVAVGKAAHPLRCLLQSSQLRQSVLLPVQNLEGSSGAQGIGPLKVSLELGTHSKGSNEKSKKLAWGDTPSSKVPPSPAGENISRSQHMSPRREQPSAHSVEDSVLHVWTPQKLPKEPTPPPGTRTSPPKSWQQAEEDPEVLLHALLMVPDGKNFSSAPLQGPNIYLNCKLFWCDEMARSVVSWGQSDPAFHFVQVTPVALTTKLLERMKNNLMVIEVWQKFGSSGQDQLLGLVKLPLHQFYMSFRDPKITHLLLQAQYPVLGVDYYMPVIDVFSGSYKGSLRVVLAMGRWEQIVSLQRSRDEEYESLSHFVRPVHLLDHQPHSQTKVQTAQVEIMQEHMFVIRVEKVSGLTPLQSTVWGEADCYVQYSFPCQEADTKVEPSLIESSMKLKPFRTTTTLCVPDPVFRHTETHVLLAPEGVPVQRLLLSSLSSQGLSSGGGVQFEVWCRYYYPNVRDQLVARGMLPLSKLCAMVTMQRQHPVEAQMFSLPLTPRTDGSTGFQPEPSGLLDVSIKYKHGPVRTEAQSRRGAASQVVTLVVQVHRASGLKAAARVLSEQDEKFNHFVGVGLNPFVTVQLSFLPESEIRYTRTTARTFCPEFDHHIEVSCDLQLHMSSGETYSLAEQLEQSDAVFTVWNRDDPKVSANVSRQKEVMLGTVKIPLADLIHKRTGISGWFGLFLTSQQQQHILVGGIEISISFAHHADRERAIKAARGLGWDTALSEAALQDDEESWEEDSTRKLSVTLSMPKAWVPVHCLLLPGLSELQRSTYCYFRYKFYDQSAFCSPLKHPCVEEGDGDGQATVSFEGSRTIEMMSSQPLRWYLREEKLEVQVWVTFMKNKTKRPSDSDRLVGSAFVDLSSLAKTPKCKLTLSGVYPLFMRSATDLQGAALRVHITLTAASVPTGPRAGPAAQVDSDAQDQELISDEAEEDDPASSPEKTPKNITQSRNQKKSSRSTQDVTPPQLAETSSEDSFPATVAVDQAMHLNLKSCPLAERSEVSPCCCVSYLTADSPEPVSTAVVANTDCPVWDHQHECRLSKELLVDPQQSLVFKVWHKGELERVIGFASVDLSPLLCGFQSVCGWYNITDFSGQCHGQIKVSITPLRGVHDLRRQRRTGPDEVAKNSSTLFQTIPLSYQTTALYSSFPSHISRYPEQKISSPSRAHRLFSERSTEGDRHFEHMDNVRLYHQNLQEQASHPVSNSSANDITPSSSLLFSSLRKKLSELDNIQRYFSRKLSTPTFPSVTEQESHPQPEAQRNSETGASHLLLKSNQLVGEVNNIISGLREHPLETIPSNGQSSSAASPAEQNSPQILPERISSPNPQDQDAVDAVSPLPSLSTESSDSHAGSEPEGEKHGQSTNLDLSEEEGEEEGAFRRDEEADDDDEKDEDYDEVVVKPRPLNEVTSLTDKTSPWTSIFSEPDLVSLESMEALGESDLSEGEGPEGKEVNPEACDSDGKHEGSGECGCCKGGDASDSERDEEKTPESPRMEASSPSRSPEVCAPPACTQPTPSTHDASGHRDNHGAGLQLSAPVEVPNFFLPPQQLEASLRAIRLAPSFSHACSDPSQSPSDQRSPPPRRAPPRCPDMSPSSMRKETERIAKIFAANCEESD
ncbi:C2 domain-containing protein 3 isoform 2-T2 [Menidia menidia]